MVHLPGGAVDQQIFYANSAATGITWSTWKKPRNCSMVHIICLAGGGGGGGGGRGTMAQIAAGGGAGGSSSQSILTIPAIMVPDILYLSVGYGGAGGIAALGKVGIASYVSVAPSNIDINNLLMSNPGSFGGTGVTGLAGATGTGGAVAGITMMPLAGMGLYAALAGQDGRVGLVNGGGTSHYLPLPLTGLFVTGGSGGGTQGTSTGLAGNNGGLFLLGSSNANGIHDATIPLYPSQLGGPGGVGSGPIGASGGDGDNGPSFVSRIGYHYGGSGGGGTGLGTGGAGLAGGNGGRGGFGCGGGGGGGSYTGQAASNGGSGGDGLIIITAW